MDVNHERSTTYVSRFFTGSEKGAAQRRCWAPGSRFAGVRTREQELVRNLRAEVLEEKGFTWPLCRFDPLCSCYAPLVPMFHGAGLAFSHTHGLPVTANESKPKTSRTDSEKEVWQRVNK